MLGLKALLAILEEANSMNAISTDWKGIRNLLREAKGTLAAGRDDKKSSPPPVGLLAGTLDEFEEFLDHSEFELAWDALAAVAEREKAPVACWRKLARAAALMRLFDKEDIALQHSAPNVSSDQALSIARSDAEKAYRNLLIYRVTITFDADGWHVDYNLREPMLNGGGPHYVIDAECGTILSKRYEQCH